MRSISSDCSRRDGAEVHEVEAQPIGRDERARLLDVRAEHLPQRRVQQVRGRVVAAGRVAQAGVDVGRHEVALRAARRSCTCTRVQARPRSACADDGGDARLAARPGDRADVGDLAAGLEIERRLGQRDEAVLARRRATATSCRSLSNSARTCVLSVVVS